MVFKRQVEKIGRKRMGREKKREGGREGEREISDEEAECQYP